AVTRGLQAGAYGPARRIVERDRPAALAPTFAQKPCPRLGRRALVASRMSPAVVRPAVEPRAARKRIDVVTPVTCRVAIAVEQHVAQAIANFGRRLQRACVIALGEQRAFAPEQLVKVAREPHTQALHATCER